jgi:4-amino-4-deoxychorismate lyase
MIHYCKGEYTHRGVTLEPTEPAFRYGAGFFETLYYNGHKTCHLELHLDRLLHALRAYQADYETIDFEEVISQVINRNGLVASTARINIFYPMEAPAAHPVVMAAPFEPKPYKAYRVCLCDDRHVSTLNAQKTTSYMFFHLALARARARGFDDAALVDFEDRLLETATGALLFQKDGEFFETDSPYRLASTSLALAKKVLKISPAAIPLTDLDQYDHAYLLNSLVGMRPIVTVGETAFTPDEDNCRAVSELILQDGPYA